MKKALVTLAALILWPAVGTTDVSSAAITSEISRLGANKVVAKLYESPKDWRDLMAAVATGKPQWLQVAVKLHSGVDGGTAEELLEAIGEGLEHRPKDVLALAVPTFRLEDICGGPDIDDSRFDSIQSAFAAIGRRQRKVASIAEPDLRKRADECIRMLEESKHQIERFFGKPSAMAPNKSLERTREG